MQIDHHQQHQSGSEAGQTTSEYALVLLVAGTIALLALSWAQDNDVIDALFDAVLSRVTSLVGVH